MNLLITYHTHTTQVSRSVCRLDKNLHQTRIYAPSCHFLCSLPAIISHVKQNKYKQLLRAAVPFDTQYRPLF